MLVMHGDVPENAVARFIDLPCPQNSYISMNSRLEDVFLSIKGCRLSLDSGGDDSLLGIGLLFRP
jgi:hypothetical protein